MRRAPIDGKAACAALVVRPRYRAIGAPDDRLRAHISSSGARVRFMLAVRVHGQSPPPPPSSSSSSLSATSSSSSSWPSWPYLSARLHAAAAAAKAQLSKSTLAQLLSAAYIARGTDRKHRRVCCRQEPNEIVSARLFVGRSHTHTHTHR